MGKVQKLGLNLPLPPPQFFSIGAGRAQGHCGLPKPLAQRVGPPRVWGTVFLHKVRGGLRDLPHFSHFFAHLHHGLPHFGVGP